LRQYSFAKESQNQTVIREKQRSNEKIKRKMLMKLTPNVISLGQKKIIKLHQKMRVTGDRNH